MNINHSQLTSHVNESNVLENYPYSSYEELSSNSKHILSSSYNPTPYPCPSTTIYTDRHLLNSDISDSYRNGFLINNQQKTNPYFVVVAVDFGTTFSGYAFAFTRDADSILMMRKVDGNDPGLFFSCTIFT